MSLLTFVSIVSAAGDAIATATAVTLLLAVTGAGRLSPPSHESGESCRRQAAPSHRQHPPGRVESSGEGFLRGPLQADRHPIRMSANAGILAAVAGSFAATSAA